MARQQQTAAQRKEQAKKRGEAQKKFQEKFGKKQTPAGTKVVTGKKTTTSTMPFNQAKHRPPGGLAELARKTKKKKKTTTTTIKKNR